MTVVIKGTHWVNTAMAAILLGPVQYPHACVHTHTHTHTHTYTHTHMHSSAFTTCHSIHTGFNLCIYSSHTCSPCSHKHCHNKVSGTPGDGGKDDIDGPLGRKIGGFLSRSPSMLSLQSMFLGKDGEF